MDTCRLPPPKGKGNYEYIVREKGRREGQEKRARKKGKRKGQEKRSREKGKRKGQASGEQKCRRGRMRKQTCKCGKSLLSSAAIRADRAEVSVR